MPTKQTELDIKIVKINSLNELPDNVRKHQEEDINFLRQQLARYGQYKNIVVSKQKVRGLDKVIIAGNGLWQAMKLEGYKNIAIQIKDVTEKEAIAFAIQDNRSAELSAWEFSNLKESMLELKEINYNLEDLGWDIEGIENIITWQPEGTENQPDLKADNVPDIDYDNTVCKIGDLWHVGQHRLLCGDCTDKSLVQYLMDGKKADMVFTDPPYGVSYSSKNEFLNKWDKGNSVQTDIENDQLSIQNVSILWGKAFSNLSVKLNNYSAYYICSPQGGDLFLMMMMMNENGLPLRHCLIWVKNNHVLGRSDYNYKHEPILYGWAKKHKFYNNGRFDKSTWEIPKPHNSDLHPTMKPIALIENAILNSSLHDMIVIDPFLGSGSTLIACEKTNRICYGMEIEPYYCDVIIKRYIDYTGKNDVVRIKDNKNWQELCKQD